MARYAMPSFQVVVSDEENGEFPIRVVATVTEGNRPSVGTKVSFYANAKILGMSSTKGDGRSVFETTLPEGVYLFEAVVNDEPAVSAEPLRKTLKRSAPKTPALRTPANMGVAALGESGKFEVVVTVTDKEGKPCAGISIKIVDEKTREVVTKKTDSDGSVSHVVEFDDSQRKYKVWVGQFVNAKNPEQLVLSGPENTGNRIPPLKTSPHPPRSLLDAIRSGLRKGVEDLEKEAAKR